MRGRRLASRRLGLAAWLLVAACAWASHAAAASLETISLQHRRAEDLVPLLQPLLPPDAAVTGTGDVLFVRADAATLRNVRTAVAAFDRAPRQLLITVGQSSGSTDRRADVRGTATIGSGDVQVGVGRPPATDPGATVTARQLATRDGLRTVSSVRALEGHETFVATAETRPFTTTTVTGQPPFGTTVTRTTEFQSAQSGFFATPRVSGERVTLDISPQQQRFTNGARPATVATQSLTTTVSGRLGEWIEIGGVADQRSGSTQGLLTWGTRSGATTYSVWVKVDEVQ